MMVGEARSFYFEVPCDYAVVFNHHPLGEARRRLSNAEQVLPWLTEAGYTHLLVHWDELVRLRSTYGFDPAIDAELLASLVENGMTEVESYLLPDRTAPYATLFMVPIK
jgi:hypothetical protein